MTLSAPELLKHYPDYTFTAGEEFLFDAADDIIYYVTDEMDSSEGQLALLHEIAHAQLGHFHYTSDFELYAMETRAWSHTRALATRHNLAVPESYIEDCLASYAHWLSKRSTCPICQNFSTQIDESTYRCFLCTTRWRVQIDALARTRRVRIDS